MKKQPITLIVIIIILIIAGVFIWKNMSPNTSKNSPINTSPNNPINKSVNKIADDKVAADVAPSEVNNGIIPPAKDEGALKSSFTYDISLDKVVGRKWVWVQTINYDDTVFTPKKSGVFSLTLNKDGTLDGTTDCNSFFGKFSAKDGNITFSSMGQTEMYCEGSEESKFTTYLAQVSGFKENGDGDLVLNLQYDSGSMIFK